MNRDLHSIQFTLAKLGELWLPKALIAAALAVLDYVLPTSAARELAAVTFGVIILDTLTGVVAAWTNKVPIQSAKMRRLLLKVFGYAVFLIVATVVARWIDSTTDADAAQNLIVTSALGWIIATECISILENLAAAGLPMPPQLQKWLSERLGNKIAQHHNNTEQP